jgi:hypothetical protein
MTSTNTPQINAIVRAIKSPNGLATMLGYVDTLARGQPAKHNTRLNLLKYRIIIMRGMVVEDEDIARRCDYRFPNGSPEQELATEKHWAIYEPAQHSLRLSLAVEIAYRAYSLFPKGSANRQAALNTYWRLFDPVKKSGDLRLAFEIASNVYDCFPRNSLERQTAERSLGAILPRLYSTKFDVAISKVHGVKKREVHERAKRGDCVSVN